MDFGSSGTEKHDPDLCRLERRNALDAELRTAIAAALEELADDGSDAPGAPSTSDASGEAEVPVRAVLIRGEGPAFCAGANLKGGAYAAGFFATVEKMIAAISSVPFPVIADVQGPAVGAGCQLVCPVTCGSWGPCQGVGAGGEPRLRAGPLDDQPRGRTARRLGRAQRPDRR